jgi:hypothetical protein
MKKLNDTIAPQQSVQQQETGMCSHHLASDAAALRFWS